LVSSPSSLRPHSTGFNALISPFNNSTLISPLDILLHLSFDHRSLYNRDLKRNTAIRYTQIKNWIDINCNYITVRYCASKYSYGIATYLSFTNKVIIDSFNRLQWIFIAE